jgi:hypothetical protein
MFERSKSNRKSKRKNSFGNDSKTYGLLQNTEWYQYEVIQKMILKDVSLKRLTAFSFNCSVLSTPNDDMFLMADDLRYAFSDFFVFFAIVSSSCVLIVSVASFTSLID